MGWGFGSRSLESFLGGVVLTCFNHIRFIHIETAFFPQYQASPPTFSSYWTQCSSVLEHDPSKRVPSSLEGFKAVGHGRHCLMESVSGVSSQVTLWTMATAAVQADPKEMTSPIPTRIPNIFRIAQCLDYMLEL